MPPTYNMQAIQLDLFTGRRIDSSGHDTINKLFNWCDHDDEDYSAEDDLACLNPCATCELKDVCSDDDCACNSANFNLLGTRFQNLEQYITALKLQGWWHPAKSYIVKH